MKKKYILLMLILFQIILLVGGQLKKVNAEEVSMHTIAFHSDEGFLAYYTDPVNNLVDYNGGTADDKDYVINVYNKIQATQLPWGSREGYRLIGWKIEGNNNPDDTLFVGNCGYGQSIVDYVVSEDVTFVAQWEKEYTLTFYSEYGYINGDVNKQEYILNNYAGSDNLSFRCPSISGCEGYVVTGWRVEGEDELFVLENTNTSEGKKNINEYIVTRDTTFIA